MKKIKYISAELLWNPATFIINLEIVYMVFQLAKTMYFRNGFFFDTLLIIPLLWCRYRYGYNKVLIIPIVIASAYTIGIAGSDVPFMMLLCLAFNWFLFRQSGAPKQEQEQEQEQELKQDVTWGNKPDE